MAASRERGSKITELIIYQEITFTAIPPQFIKLPPINKDSLCTSYHKQEIAARKHAQNSKKKLEARMESGEIQAKYSKLEVQRFQEQIERLNLLYGGIKNMQAAPGVVVVSDIITDLIAIKEAKKCGIPVVGIADTNTDPNLVDIAIPANDDAIKSIELIMSYLASAVQAKTEAPA